MRRSWIVASLACALACACAGCESQKKTTRKVSVEGPEKKTEIKLETTKKEKDD